VLKKDFENDLKEEIAKISKRMGIKISLKDSFRKIIRDYLTVRFKIIDIKKRRVRFNPDFFVELNNHQKRNEIQHISQLASIGGNLNTFQSKKLLQTGFHDHLLSAWNIYHFHLSLSIDKKTKFVKQTNDLLFAYIDYDQIIFLGTDKHKDGIFADIKWLEILHDYFPEVIEKYRDNKIKDIRLKVNSSERQMIWNSGLMIGMTKVRDAVYHNPGIGRATSGHSTAVTSTTVDIIRWISKLDIQLNDSTKEVCDYLNIKTKDAKFKIRLENKLELIELSKNIKILEFPEVFIDRNELLKKNK